MEKKQPIHKLRDGRLSAAVWENQTKDGKTVASVTFIRTYRPGPPDYTHCLVLNVATREDGTTGSLLSKPLYQHKMAAGALYRAELAQVLSQTLGYALKATKHGFEITGVPDALVHEFSILTALGPHRRASARGCRSGSPYDANE